MTDKLDDEDIDGVGRGLLSRLSEVSLRVREGIDLDTLLQEMVDEALLLTGAGSRGMNAIGHSGQIQEQHQWLVALAGIAGLFVTGMPVIYMMTRRHREEHRRQGRWYEVGFVSERWS